MTDYTTEATPYKDSLVGNVIELADHIHHTPTQNDGKRPMLIPMSRDTDMAVFCVPVTLLFENL
jgi:hypothetical protein